MGPRGKALGRLQRLLGITKLGDDVWEHVGRLYDIAANHEERIRRHEAVAAISMWLEQATLTGEPLISVVTPTRNRSTRLIRAVDSVLGQDYANWELLVVDDGSTDTTAEALARFGDPRIRGFRIDPSGAAVARNRALAEARGELIAYLDDDNAMRPLWLKAVAWAFEQRPDTDVLYGAWVIDDPSRLRGERGAERGLPELWFTPWSRELQREQALADQSTIAHRAGLAEARFDESLDARHDWDLLARLTADKDPLALPVVACAYSTDAAARLSTRASMRRDKARLRARLRA